MSILGLFISRSPLSHFIEHPYGYCYHTPVIITDPTGLLGWPVAGPGNGYGYPIPGGEVARECVERIGKFVRKQFPVSGEDDRQNHMRHCMWSCIMNQQCGNSIAFLAGWYNEYRGVYDAKDVYANQKGRNCGDDCKNRDCYKCCREEFNPYMVTDHPPDLIYCVPEMAQ